MCPASPAQRMTRAVDPLPAVKMSWVPAFITSRQNSLNSILKHWYLAQLAEYSRSSMLPESDHSLMN